MWSPCMYCSVHSHIRWGGKRNPKSQMFLQWQVISKSAKSSYLICVELSMQVVLKDWLQILKLVTTATRACCRRPALLLRPCYMTSVMCVWIRYSLATPSVVHSYLQGTPLRCWTSGHPSCTRTCISLARNGLQTSLACHRCNRSLRSLSLNSSHEFEMWLVHERYK